LAKADLTTGVVGEFPELQGVMGRYYALHDNIPHDVADAVRDHYKPVGPSDTVPEGPVSIAVALADKLDSLVWFFAASIKPTGSSDPFAMRRSALGVIRILLENGTRFALEAVLRRMLDGAIVYSSATVKDGNTLLEFKTYLRTNELHDVKTVVKGILSDERNRSESQNYRKKWTDSVVESVLEFFADRLKVALKEKGTRHDLIDAVFSLGHEDDLVRLVARVEALQAFLKSEDGATLLAGYKRAANILKVEEKKDAKTYVSEVDENLLAEPAEKALFAALTKAQAAIAPALEKEDFAAAMRQMASLRAPVDAFFESVKVNADDAKLRENRLHLLASFRAALHKVADFSRIEG